MWYQAVWYKITVASEEPAALPHRLACSSETSVTFHSKLYGITLQQITSEPCIQFLLVCDFNSIFSLFFLPLILILSSSSSHFYSLI